MNEAFIWLSGLCFIDNFFILIPRNFFRIFTENKPVGGLWKKYNIPKVNWLKIYRQLPFIIFIAISQSFLISREHYLKK